MRYLPPGQPPPSLPGPTANTYLAPSGSLQQAPPPSQQPPPQSRDQHDPHRSTLVAEWRTQHGSDWVRADDLGATVRQMIDERGRINAVRQKLRQLAKTPGGGFRLESEVRGNRAKPVAYYRLTERENAGLEG